MERSIRFVSLLSVLLLAAAVALWVGPAHADNAAWTGATDAAWSTVGPPTNWDNTPGAVPGTGDTATFNAPVGVGGGAIDLGGGVTVGAIVFDSVNAAAYTIGSGAVGSQTLTLDDTAAVMMNSTVTANELFNAAITLGATDQAGTTTFTNESTTNTLSFAGNITGSANAVSAGAKILAVAGAGNTDISGIVADGGALSVGLTKDGAGTWTLNNANTYTGGTTINAGILKAGSTTAFGTATGASLTFGSGSTGTVQLNGNSMTVIGLNTADLLPPTGAIVENSGAGTATLTVDNAGDNTFAGTLQNGSAGTLALTKTGAGTLTLSGTNTYSGGTTINGGTLSFSSSLPTAGTININNNSNSLAVWSFYGGKGGSFPVVR
jgi:autotransporter-associated beta strand protein